MKALVKKNAGGGKVAAYAVPTATIAGLSAAGAYGLTRNRNTAIASAMIGAVIGIAVAAYSRR